MDYDFSKRFDKKYLEAEFKKFNNENTVGLALDLVRSMILIVNETRQVIYANKAFCEKFNTLEKKDILGRRLGEILNCIYSKGINGCGTKEQCKECRALDAYLSVQHRGARSKEWARLYSDVGESIVISDFEVHGEPYNFDGNDYVLLTLLDNKSEIRKKEFERIFFHDVLNTTGGIKGILQLIKEEIPKSSSEDFELIDTAFTDLIDVIEVQRKLSLKEEGEPYLLNEMVNSIELLEFMRDFFVKIDGDINNRIFISDESVNLNIKTDKIVLKRIMQNMIKNSLEATNSDEMITIGCRLKGSQDIEFWVHNPGEIDKTKEKYIFRERVSTKGKNRGWGTLSMKVLGESFLKGKVYYKTDNASGTTFNVVLPIKT